MVMSKSNERRVLGIKLGILIQGSNVMGERKARIGRLESTRTGGAQAFAARVGSRPVAMDTLDGLCPLTSGWLGHG